MSRRKTVDGSFYFRRNRQHLKNFRLSTDYRLRSNFFRHSLSVNDSGGLKNCPPELIQIVMNFFRVFLSCLFFSLYCTASAQPVKSNFVLTVKDDSAVTLKAKDVPLSEIIEVLARKIHLPISLSESLKNERITVNFSNLPWQEVLREFAPQGYADFVVAGGLNQQPQCLGIYLLDHAEKQPAQDINIASRSQAFLLEGDTEASESPKAAEEIPLQVSVTQGLLTVRARQQPLSVVLYKIAESFGIAFELFGNRVPR